MGRKKKPTGDLQEQKQEDGPGPYKTQEHHPTKGEMQK